MSGLSRATLFAIEVNKKQHPLWTLRITPNHHPHLYRAIDTVSHDAGGGAGHPFHLISPVWEPYLADLDMALAGLSGKDFETFCIGGEDEHTLIADRNGALIVASALLDEWFDSPEDAQQSGEARS